VRITEYQPILQSSGTPNGVRRRSLLELDTLTRSTMTDISESSYWRERNPRTITLFEVSGGTGWWDPAYCRLADSRHHNGAQHRCCRQDRACPPSKPRICRPAWAKIGIVGSEVPVAAAGAPPSCGLQLSTVDVEALFPSVSAAPRGRTPLENCAAASSKKDCRRRVEKSPPPPSPPGFARQAL
jgi:hypothetical protein